MMAGAVPKSMKSVSFSIRRVNRLRRAAERTRIVPVADRDLSPLGGPSNGWIASACNPNDLVGVFDTLWLKVGFALHAYEYREGSNGNGIIWAVPADAPLVAPDECARLVDTWLAPPRPPGAVPLMQAMVIIYDGNHARHPNSTLSPLTGPERPHGVRAPSCSCRPPSAQGEPPLLPAWRGYTR